MVDKCDTSHIKIKTLVSHASLVRFLLAEGERSGGKYSCPASFVLAAKTCKEIKTGGLQIVARPIKRRDETGSSSSSSSSGSSSSSSSSKKQQGPNVMDLEAAMLLQQQQQQQQHQQRLERIQQKLDEEQQRQREQQRLQQEQDIRRFEKLSVRSCSSIFLVTLHDVCSEGLLALAKAFLRSGGFSPVGRDERDGEFRGQTPLMAACASGNIDLVLMLLELDEVAHSSFMQDEDDKGRTAVTRAMSVRDESYRQQVCDEFAKTELRQQKSGV